MGTHQSGTKNIVVIGGGTGTYTVLSGLKKYSKERVSLSAIISVSDSGGSTGQLRDEFGFLPVGDFRMALAALSESENGDTVLRDLFLYRFNKGEGLKGHNFGNLFLVAMTDIFGSTEKAIELTGEVLKVRGKVIPITTSEVTLCAEYEDSSIKKGESSIDEPNQTHDGTQHIKKLWLEPESFVSPNALRAIKEADIIVLGPGDLYTSTLSNIIVKGAPEAIRKSGAKFVYVVNIMSKYGQTHGFTANDYVKELTTYVGRTPDYVLINNTPLPVNVVEKYKLQKEFPVIDDVNDNDVYEVFRKDFLASEEIQKPDGDVLKRSLLRHDADKLAEIIMSLV